MDFSEYIGLPWKSLGRDRAGVDCCGLVLLILRERFGVDAPDYLFDYPDALDAKAVSAVVEREASTRWKKVEGMPRAGDVVVFRRARLQSHVGLLIGDGRFVHILPPPKPDRPTNSCTARLDAIIWRHRIEGFYRYQSTGCVLQSSPSGRGHGEGSDAE